MKSSLHLTLPVDLTVQRPLTLQVRELVRDDVECDLQFAGFVIISCPLKVDSKAAIRELQHSSHYVSQSHPAGVLFKV